MANLFPRRAWLALAIMFLVGWASAKPACADPVARNTSAPLAATPPMGFNNWARFQCLPQAPLDGRDPATYGFEDFMLDQAKALVATGLAAAGYRTVVVDDCWMQRDPDGVLRGIDHWGSFKHPSAQPGFEPDLTHYMATLHALGLQGGVYNTSGKTTCQKVAAGEAGHQEADAARFAVWGVDFLKLDNCGAADDDLPGLFRQMADALGHATAGRERKILFAESAPAQYAPADPMKYQSMEWVRPLGQMWRVAPDIRITHLGPDGRPLYDPWSFNDAAQGYEEGVYQAFTDTIALSRYVAPGNWNDADQLLIGDGGLTTAEERSQMGLWAMMAAPLILSADVRAMALRPADPHFAAALDILENPRAIAIDQDPAGVAGYLVMRDSSADDMGVDLVVRPLADGGLAVLALNKGPLPVDYKIALASLGIETLGGPCPIGATDVWSGATTVVDPRGALGGPIAAHDTLMVRLAPTRCASFTPVGQITAAQAEFASPPLCLQAGESGGVTVESCTASPAQQWRLDSGEHIRPATGPGCLTLGAAGEAASVMACDGRSPQTFAYRRSGALAAGGLCLAVETGKVGHGGLIGQQGARVRAEACRPFAPEQAFSAPHLGLPAA